MLKSALLILSGQAFNSALLLIRNLLIARLISVEDYGIAATFAISMALIEMMTTLGLNQLIIQDTEGDDPRLQSGLQGFHLIRSIFSGIILFCLAKPIAIFLNVQDIFWAYQLLAFVPVVNGLVHFDLYRLQRRMIYLPSVISSALPTLASVFFIWPLWEIYGDYRVMLFSVMLQSVLAVGISHLVAERRYNLSFDTNVITRALQFGWPLLINNFLLFFIFQNEKIIVGRVLGLETLAIFAMGFALTLTPASLLAGSFQSFFLPQLASVKDKRDRFDHLAMVTLQSHLLFGALFVVGIVLFADPIVHLLLSSKYETLVPLMTWLAILQVLRVFRSGCATIALAKGKAGIATIANLPRVFSTPIAWYAAIQTEDILVILWIAIIGDFIGFAISIFLLHWQLKLSLSRAILPIFLILMSVTLSGIQAWLANPTYDISHGSLLVTGVFIVLFGFAFASMKDLRRYGVDTFF